MVTRFPLPGSSCLCDSHPSLDGNTQTGKHPRARSRHPAAPVSRGRIIPWNRHCVFVEYSVLTQHLNGLRVQPSIP